MFDNDQYLPNNNEKNWNNWEPLWTGNNETPHDFQEQHSPTSQSHKKETKSSTKSRIVDERLWKAMSLTEQDAALSIAASFDNLTKGIGFTTVNWEKIPGASCNVAELHAELINIYMQWGEECLKNSISHSAIIDILCYGESCIQSDTKRRLRKGTAKKNLLQGLALYCKIRGWY